MAFLCAYIVFVDHMFHIPGDLYIATGAGTSSLEQTYIDCHTNLYLACAARVLNGFRTAPTCTKCRDVTPAPRLFSQGSIQSSLRCWTASSPNQSFISARWQIPYGTSANCSSQLVAFTYRNMCSTVEAESWLRSSHYRNAASQLRKAVSRRSC